MSKRLIDRYAKATPEQRVKLQKAMEDVKSKREAIITAEKILRPKHDDEIETFSKYIYFLKMRP